MFGGFFGSAFRGAMGERDGEAGPRHSECLRIHGEALHETDAAILFRFDDEEIWFPKSHARLAGKTEEGRDILVITRWIAQQKNLV